MRRLLDGDFLERRPVLAVTTWFALTRVLVVLVGMVGRLFPVPRVVEAWTNPGYGGDFHGPPSPLIEAFFRWDAFWYLRIAQDGYEAAAPGQPVPDQAAFFPLYPLVLRAFSLVTGELFWSGALVAHAASLGAVLFMLAWARQAMATENAVRASILFMVSPGGNFLSYPYTEPLFSLFLLAALTYAGAGKPWRAALAGALACGTRSTGVVVGVVLLWEAWKARKDLGRAARWVLAAAASGGGLYAYALFCHFHHGNALAFAQVQSRWGRSFSLLGPIQAFLRFDIYPDFYVVTLAALAGAVWLTRRVDVPARLVMWFLLLLPLSTGTLTSMIRFVGGNVSLSLGAAQHLDRRRFLWLLAASLLLMLYETSQYAMGFMNC